MHAPAAAAAGPPVRPGRTGRDMALSLVVLLIPVFAIVGIYRLVHGGDRPVVVDPAPVVAQARAAGDFPVAEPTGLPDGWRPVSATRRAGADGAVLRLGYLTPDGNGVQLIQSDTPPQTLLPAELTDAARPDGAVQVAGQSWQRYRTRPGEQALVLLAPDVTIVAIGSATEAELRTLAQSLRR